MQNMDNYEAGRTLRAFLGSGDGIRYVCLAPTHNPWDGDKRFIDVEVGE